MELTRSRTLKKLRRLAPKMSQAEAARELGLHRQWVHKLGQDHGIVFRRQRVVVRPRVCSRCEFRVGEHKTCLRCKWTPARIRRLRSRLGVSQYVMSIVVLKMNVWACSRWERELSHPSRKALTLLEQVEKRR